MINVIQCKSTMLCKLITKMFEVVFSAVPVVSVFAF